MAMGLWDSEQWTECMVALTFFEFCSFGEPKKPEPELWTRGGAAAELQERPVPERCKAPQRLPETPGWRGGSDGGGSGQWQEPETFGLFLFV